MVGKPYLRTSELPVTPEGWGMISGFAIQRLESVESARNIIFPESD